ncbi:hypothetical protein C1H46_035271 [Malus baccata]|uniref:Uncharacterized protein n=1 Tax=Malus baccata TaxID=106549 RepID=A0A540KYD1_MALBA|nr:hypothetical protein C1H46_035271 [Malus baccata]
MKLEISALEHSCFEAKKIQEEETAEENTRMSLLIQGLELFNVWDAKKTAEFFEMENKELRKKLDTYRRQILGGKARLVRRNREELKEEKLKANEEAEDLAQEMAEFSLFRYTDRMTGLLEEECKRRACIEQASLHRIAELEAQVLMFRFVMYVSVTRESTHLKRIICFCDKKKNGPNPLPLSDIFMNAEGSSIPRITWLIFQRQFSLLWLWIDRRIVQR